MSKRIGKRNLRFLGKTKQQRKNDRLNKGRPQKLFSPRHRRLLALEIRKLTIPKERLLVARTVANALAKDSPNFKLSEFIESIMDFNSIPEDQAR